MKTKISSITPNIIVGIGELLWDKLPEGKKLGGAPANFAYHVSQLGHQSCAISAIGNDSDGNEILAEIDTKNINTLISKVDFPTGTVDVTMSGNGIPSYKINTNVAWDNIPFNDKTAEIASNTIAVCFGSLAQRSKTSRNTIAQFINAMPNSVETLKIFDINLRQNFYSKEIITESLTLCNILKINDSELDIVSDLYQISGTVSDRCHKLIRNHNLRIIILTCGENGSYVFSSDGTHSFITTPKVNVADTVGAGDSFTAAFTAATLRGASIAEAHQVAVNISAYVCTQQGATPRLPKEFKLNI